MTVVHWGYLLLAAMLIASAVVLAIGNAVARRRNIEDAIIRRRKPEDGE
ncbi:hypothetical protein [Pseudomonas sp. R5(2019)]|nr:hypothetical protein [Pseudomonas sp. R5(2019)]NBA94902.1 hypothetical protein [Pseudomonas sp. R5(2019)]